MRDYNILSSGALCGGDKIFSILIWYLCCQLWWNLRNIPRYPDNNIRICYWEIEIGEYYNSEIVVDVWIKAQLSTRHDRLLIHYIYSDASGTDGWFSFGTHYGIEKSRIKFENIFLCITSVDIKKVLSLISVLYKKRRQPP